MHILLLHQYYQEKDDPGGMRWNELTRIWAEKGHHITVIAGMTHYTKGFKHEKYKRKYFHTDNHSDRIRVIRTHVSELYNQSYAGRLWAYVSFVWSSTFAGLFKAREKYDIIIASSPPLPIGLPAYIISRMKRIPLVFEIRDLWPESAIETGVLKKKWLIKYAYRFEAFMYRKAKLINALTPSFRDILIRDKKVEASKVIQVPNAADFKIVEELNASLHRDEIRKKLGIQNQLAAIYVGAHGVANHLEQILDAASLLRENPVVFLLVGDGMRKQYLVDKAREMKLENVRFYPSVSKKEALQYILASDIGISALQKTEAFKTVWSNKTFDYMSCKKPILMAIDGISKELVETADAGLYAEPENAEAIADKIRFWLHNPNRISEQGENGYRYAREHFDREALAQEYLSQIERVAGPLKTVTEKRQSASDVS